VRTLSWLAVEIFWIAAIIFIFVLPGRSQVTVGVPLFEPPTQGTDYNPTPGASSYTGTGGIVLNILTGTPPFSCAVTSGAIPTSMTLDEVTPTSTPAGGCRIKGTPTVAGDFVFTLQVTDANSNTASQSVTVPVNTSSPATYSAQTCGSPGVSTATCTWTTSVATTTQLCGSMDNTFPKGVPGSSGPASFCTTETDLTGVTSHSVSLSGLAENAKYYVYFIGRGISAGSPQDYLFSFNEPSCAGNPGCGSSFFTTAVASNAGTADFSLQMYGAHNIIQGFPLYVAIHPWPLVGVTDITGHNVVFQVTGLPTNSQVHWPDQQDDGCACGTVSTTTTTNDTFTLVGGVSIVNNEQFEILTNVGGTTPVGSSTLTLTVTVGATPTIHTFNWTLNVAAPSFTFGSPSSYPAIPSLSTWTSNQSIGNLDWATPGGSQGICSMGFTNVGFYDGAWAFYQGGIWNGQSIPWAQDARVCSQNYQNTEVNVIGSDTNWQSFAIFVHPHGQYYECKQYGIPLSCNGVAALPACCGGSMISNSTPYASADYARESAFMLSAKRLDYDNGGATTLAKVKTMAAYVLGNIDQYVNEDTTILNETFMHGLLGQAAIEFYADPNTGNGDVRVPQAVCGMADHLWSTWFVPWNGAAGGFPYEHDTWASTKSAGWKSVPAFGAGGSALEDLNNLIAPVFAWCFSITGQQKYQQEFDTLFNSSNLEPLNIGEGAVGKTWTQNYRWTYLGLLWRGATAPSGAGIGCFQLPQTGTCPRVQLPVPAVGSPTL
jgi:hypothetical protein